MTAFGIRALERDTGVSHHTIDKVQAGSPVRRATVARIVAALDAASATCRQERGIGDSPARRARSTSITT
jgi:hypothetical protein